MTITQNLTRHISISILFIIFSLLVLIFGRFSPIEIANSSLSFIFYSVIIIGLPIVTLKEIRTRLTRLKNQTLISTIKIIFTCLGLFYIFYAIIFCFGNTMCGDLTDETLFINKKTNSSKIIVRHFDCGATDSGPAKYEIVKIVNIFSAFNFVTKVDTAKIDKNVWVNADEN